MITQVDVDSENAFYVAIAAATPRDSLLIRKITGLNPPDISLFIGDYAHDGGYYQGRRVAKRNPVFTFDLNPKYTSGETVSGLRNMLYKAFIDPQLDGDHLKITFHDDTIEDTYLLGYTEKFDSELFDVETMCQISMVCPDPYLRAVTETIVSDSTGLPEIGFTYDGTAETGFQAVIKITSATSTLTVDVNGKKTVFNRPFAINDVITLNTTVGARSATVLSAITGLTLPLIGAMTADSDWVQLHSTSSALKVYGATSTDNVASTVDFRFRNAYWGL